MDPNQLGRREAVVLRPSAQSVTRSATDRVLLEQVIARGRVTLAELAATTGISKPTVSEAVRRLVAGGLLDAVGAQETGRRGRVGTFYALGAGAGWVLAVEVNQSGVQAWSSDLAGRPSRRAEQPPGAVGDTDAVVAALRSAVQAAVIAAGSSQGPLRAVAVSVANPVHPVTHDVLALTDSAFPEGLLSPANVLADLVHPAPVLVDNDVNLAALAEHRAGNAAGAASFAYVYVGAGLGLGLYIGDQLIRGAHGLAGEIGFLPGASTAVGSGALATEFANCGFRRSDTLSVDVTTAVTLLDRTHDSGDQEAQAALGIIGSVITRVIASVNAVVDPELILLGGPIGTHPALLPTVRDALTRRPTDPTRLAYGLLGTSAPLHGATYLALEHAEAAVMTDTRNAAI